MWFEPDGTRRNLSRDALLAPAECAGLPAAISDALRRAWPRQMLGRALAETLLWQDVRPDDRVMIAGVPAWPALSALAEGACVVLYAGQQPSLTPAIASERISVALVGADWQDALPEAGAAGASLRGVALAGGAWSAASNGFAPHVRRLAVDGVVAWGNPLDPPGMALRPEAALFAPRDAARPPASGPGPG